MHVAPQEMWDLASRSSELSRMSQLLPKGCFVKCFSKEPSKFLLLCRNVNNSWLGKREQQTEWIFVTYLIPVTSVPASRAVNIFIIPWIILEQNTGMVSAASVLLVIGTNETKSHVIPINSMTKPVISYLYTTRSNPDPNKRKWGTITSK